MKIFLDGSMTFPADGYTFNPSLMKKAGITDYKSYALDCIARAAGKPISFEVLADELWRMEEQAYEIASWGKNVYVKIPAMVTNGLDTLPVVSPLSKAGIQINVTAVFTFTQINTFCHSLCPSTPSILSVFCGRIADTGRDPVPYITQALRVKNDKTKVLWASTRELLNIKQAEAAGCDIITLSEELFAKQHLMGKDLHQYSLETVRQFYEDGRGISL